MNLAQAFARSSAEGFIFKLETHLKVDAQLGVGQIIFYGSDAKVIGAKYVQLCFARPRACIVAIKGV